MKIWLLAIALIGWSAAEATADDEIEIRPGTKVSFATAAEGARLLGARDVFVEAMSEFDRAARLKTDQDVTEQQYLEFAAKQAQDWSAEEKAKVRTILASFREKSAQLELNFPASISLIKTTGLEEGKAAYCRESAIVIPINHLDGDATRLAHLVFHELFHIYRSHYPDNRRALYKIIDFEVCPQIDLPEDLRSRKITNPDAPRIDSVIRIRVDGRRVPATPVLYSKNERYDTKAGGEFFRSLVFQLMVLDEVGDGFQPALLPGGKPPLLDRQRCSRLLRPGRSEYAVHHSSGGNFGREFCPDAREFIVAAISQNR